MAPEAGAGRRAAGADKASGAGAAGVSRRRPIRGWGGPQGERERPEGRGRGPGVGIDPFYKSTAAAAVLPDSHRGRYLSTAEPNGDPDPSGPEPQGSGREGRGGGARASGPVPREARPGGVAQTLALFLGPKTSSAAGPDPRTASPRGRWAS